MKNWTVMGCANIINEIPRPEFVSTTQMTDFTDGLFVIVIKQVGHFRIKPSEM